jgi:hypothetical protein
MDNRRLFRAARDHARAAIQMMSSTYVNCPQAMKELHRAQEIEVGLANLGVNLPAGVQEVMQEAWLLHLETCGAGPSYGLAGALNEAFAGLTRRWHAHPYPR